MKAARYNPEEKIRKLKPWQLKLHEIIFEADTPAGKLFDIALLVAILLSVVAVMLESVDEVEAAYGSELRAIEWVFTILFTIEYILRLISVGKPLRYVFSFFGIIDLLSIVPTYLSFFVTGTQSLLVIRAIRLLRVFRILKLARYFNEAQIMVEALKASKAKILVFLGAVLCITCIMGTLLYLIEGGENGFTSIPRSVYWAIVTLTTVGYGDIAPQTVFGQIAASCIMIMGYAIIVVSTGIVAAEMVGQRKENISTIACHQCAAAGHNPGAKHCYGCGAELD